MSVPRPRRAKTFDTAFAAVPEQDAVAAAPARSISQRRSQPPPPHHAPLTMAEPPPLPPSYDAAVGGAAPPDASPDDLGQAQVSYSAYADYIDDYTQPSPAPSHATLDSRSRLSASSELEDKFANMSMSSNPHTPYLPGGQPGAYPSPYGVGPSHPRQRSVTEGFTSNRTMDPAASVYSLDSGMGMYKTPTPPMPRRYGAGTAPPPTWNPNNVASAPPQAAAPGDPYNPYYSAANDFLGLPPGTQTPYPLTGAGAPPAPPPGAAPPVPHAPIRQQSIPNLARTNTSRSTMSLASVASAPPAPIPHRAQPVESVGASSTRRRGGAAAIDVSKPPYTREFVDDYRSRMKVDPDPEAQFSFAKYLIEAAKKIGDEMSARDPRAGRKYRDNLLAESLRNVKKLAESKEPYADAQFFLANLYGTGQLGLQVDHEKAYYLYLMASKLSHPAATYRAAVCCELGAGTKRDATRSVLFYRKAAALGDTAAMYKLALILLNGLMGHPRNAREAYVWLRRAASQADEDNPHALHELALLHERPNNGTQGVIPYDPHAACEYLQQASQLGYAPAQFKLGQCHEFGSLGFPIDPRRSIAWYTRAAERGNSEAELALSGWYLTGSEGVLKQSDTEAYLWGRKAANKGLAKAEYAVGYYTEIGIGVKQDMELAKRWYQRAAMQGNKRAMQRLQELSSSKNAAKGARPTRKDAESECVIM